jgi:hypothetical protein
MGNLKFSPRRAIEGMACAGAEKFEHARALLRHSEEAPEELFPFFDEIVVLLDSENSIIKWNVCKIVANLSAADREGKIAEILDHYLEPIPGPLMITAGVVIQGAARIASSQPQLADRIIGAILRVEHGRYKTDECRLIAIGHAITALGSIDSRGRQSPEVLAFVRRQLTNPRAGTRKKAEAFLKRESKATAPAAGSRKSSKRKVSPGKPARA